MTITTRKATREDRDFLWQLKVASMREYVEKIYGWDDAVQKKFFENSFHPESIRIIQLENQDVGMVELRHREDDYFLARIEVLPEFQRRGIGSIIIRRITAGASSSDCWVQSPHRPTRPPSGSRWVIRSTPFPPS